MTNHKTIRIGRDESNDLVLNHVSVSRMHLEIFVDAEQNIFLTDLNSHFGTWVNGDRIYDPIILKRGDKIIIGDNQLIDWEMIVFDKSNLSIKKLRNESWLLQNKDLIIIYGLVIITWLIINFIIS